MGIAGACLARTVGVARCSASWLCSSVLGAATGGITEQLTIGWLGLFLAALIQALRSRKTLAMGSRSLLAATVASGPYIAIWAALCATAIGIVHLKDRASWRPLAIIADSADCSPVRSSMPS